jgi:hypothetical protein
MRILRTLNTTTLVKSTVRITGISTVSIRGTVVHTDVSLRVAIRLVGSWVGRRAVGGTTVRVEETGDATAVELTVGGEEGARRGSARAEIARAVCAKP